MAKHCWRIVVCSLVFFAWSFSGCPKKNPHMVDDAGTTDAMVPCESADYC